jgi:hypothetical protein
MSLMRADAIGGMLNRLFVPFAYFFSRHAFKSSILIPCNRPGVRRFIRIEKGGLHFVIKN